MLKIVVFSIYFGFLFDGVVCQDDTYEYLDSTDFSSDNLPVGTECQRDIAEWFRGFENREAWATSMIDSMEKLPIGLMAGRRTAIGNFEECLEVVHPNFTGQHCLVELSSKKASKNFHLVEVPTSSQRIAFSQFTYGVCLPSTCNATDLKNVIKYLGLNEIFWTEVFENGCIAGTPELRTVDYYVIAVFGMLVLLAVASTLYDMLAKENKISESKRKILTSFSLQSNINYLLHISESSDAMNALHGMRFLSFTWVVMGHSTALDFKIGNEMNTEFKKKVENKLAAVPVTNAYLSVDTFFFLSGMLVCFVFFRNITQRGYHDTPAAFIHRYLRLTPGLAAVILFNSTLLTRVSVVPYSKSLLEKVEGNCRSYWWSYLLYVQNFFFTKMGECFSPAWYLCADIQMYMISPIILYVIYFWPKFAPKYLGALIVGSCTLCFFICYFYNIPPNRVMELLGPHNSFHDEYVWFFTRMTPWLVGVTTGYIICGIRAEKVSFRPGRGLVLAGWLTAAVLCGVSLFGIIEFYPAEYGITRPAIIKSSYRAFHRLGWSLGLSWTVIACVTGYGGIVNKVLSLSIFQPLAKLSYCGYLIHYQLLMYRFLNQNKSLKNLNYFDLVYTHLGDLTACLILSVPMALFVELPFSNIERNLLQNLKIMQYPKPKKSEYLYTDKQPK